VGAGPGSCSTRRRTSPRAPRSPHRKDTSPTRAVASAPGGRRASPSTRATWACRRAHPPRRHSATSRAPGLARSIEDRPSPRATSPRDADEAAVRGARARWYGALGRLADGVTLARPPQHLHIVGRVELADRPGETSPRRMRNRDPHEAAGSGRGRNGQAAGRDATPQQRGTLRARDDSARVVRGDGAHILVAAQRTTHPRKDQVDRRRG
jgi:hypothetical protein